MTIITEEEYAEIYKIIKDCTPNGKYLFPGSNLKIDRRVKVFFTKFPKFIDYLPELIKNKVMMLVVSGENGPTGSTGPRG